MKWTADVDTGAWIRDGLDAGPSWGSTMHGVVPHGFAAYARIFHPGTRDRPVGVAWPPEPIDRHRCEWEAFQAERREIDTERVTWHETAGAFGTTMHGLAQWHRLVRQNGPHPGVSPTDAAGWRYSEPAEGQLDADVLAEVCRVLAAHTTTPDEGFIALWEGWGGVTGGMGYGPSRVMFSATDAASEETDPRHAQFLGTAVRDSFNDVFRKPTWQPGVLSDDVSRGPRLSLPARDHVLFRGGVSELADPSWPLGTPWRDRSSEEHGFPPAAESPSLIWPDDRTWVLVTEVDYDSTIVAGSAELVAALCADPVLEAAMIPQGADLGWTGDGVNL